MTLPPWPIPSATARAAFVSAVLASLLPAQASAQAPIALSGLTRDNSQPVDIVADQLTVDQATGLAVFTGNVVVVQGGLRMAAPEVQVEYADGDSATLMNREVSFVRASGGVLLTSPTEAAEADRGVYELATGLITLTGAVTLTQGPNLVSGESMVIDLATGTADVAGRVRTTLQPGVAPDPQP